MTDVLKLGDKFVCYDNHYSILILSDIKTPTVVRQDMISEIFFRRIGICCRDIIYAFRKGHCNMSFEEKKNTLLILNSDNLKLHLDNDMVPISFKSDIKKRIIYDLKFTLALNTFWRILSKNHRLLAIKPLQGKDL